VPAKASAFEKRLKRRVSGRTGDFFAVCPPGLTALCRTELQGLVPRLDRMGLLPPDQRIGRIDIQPGGVSFSARLDMACLANLFLGTPTRILMRIARFRAENFPAFEKGLRAIDWELFLPPDTRPAIQASARKSRLYHTDALAERCAQVLGPLPSVEDPCQTIMIRGDRDRFEISLDMGGEPLYKRGIKSRVVRAPLRETLAFAMLKRLDLSREDVLADPMAGSGTFSLEGAMIQSRTPPGLFRSFAFEHWPAFQAPRLSHARDLVKKQIRDGQPLPPIFASDLDPAAVAALEQTRADYGFLRRMEIACKNFFDHPAPAPSGVVVLNPPYGKRIGKGVDITSFYQEIGRKLSLDYKGWRTGIICPEKQLFSALGLSLSPMPLFHGGLDLIAGLGRVS
jgi:putative N6-adenine-specific DNA methylase